MVRYLRTDDAIATPSYVDVPLPSSSTMTRDLLVQLYRMVLVSSISMKNVDLPSNNLSDAPILQNIRSKGSKVKLDAGT